MQLTIVSNVENQRPRKDGGVFGLVTTFTNDFKFIVGSGVDLQQNHKGVRVRRNAIVLSLKGIDFKTSVHLSQFKVFITRMLHQH
jgi:hypothetical protein